MLHNDANITISSAEASSYLLEASSGKFTWRPEGAHVARESGIVYSAPGEAPIGHVMGEKATLEGGDPPYYEFSDSIQDQLQAMTWAEIDKVMVPASEEWNAAEDQYWADVESGVFEAYYDDDDDMFLDGFDWDAWFNKNFPNRRDYKLKAWKPSTQWEIPRKLARTSRPGYPSKKSIPVETVDKWIADVKEKGFKSVLVLLGPDQLGLYDQVPGGLVDYYRKNGLNVVHVPTKDVGMRFRKSKTKVPKGTRFLSDRRLRAIHRAYNKLPKPVLMHCSAGLERSGEAARYIRDRERRTESRRVDADLKLSSAEASMYLIEARFGSYRYRVPKDKEQQLYDFYVLTFLPNPDAVDNPDMASSIQEVRDELIPSIKKNLLNATYYAVAAETRHIMDTVNESPEKIVKQARQELGEAQARKIAKYLREYNLYQKFPVSTGVTREAPGLRKRVMGQTAGYDNSYRAAMKAWPHDPVGYMDAAEWMFNNLNWRSSYGGKKWGAIAKGWKSLNKAKTYGDNVVYIDHVYDLQHNTDVMLNKVKSYAKNGGFSWLKKALDKKKFAASPWELYSEMSPGLRKLAAAVIKAKTGTTLEQYLKGQAASTPGGHVQQKYTPSPSAASGSKKDYVPVMKTNNVDQMAKSLHFWYGIPLPQSKTMVDNAVNLHGVSEVKSWMWPTVVLGKYKHTEILSAPPMTQGGMAKLVKVTPGTSKVDTTEKHLYYKPGSKEQGWMSAKDIGIAQTKLASNLPKSATAATPKTPAPAAPTPALEPEIQPTVQLSSAATEPFKMPVHSVYVSVNKPENLKDETSGMKIATIKGVRKTYGMGLKEAKGVVDQAESKDHEVGTSSYKYNDLWWPMGEFMTVSDNLLPGVHWGQAGVGFAVEGESGWAPAVSSLKMLSMNNAWYVAAQSIMDNKKIPEISKNAPVVSEPMLKVVGYKDDVKKSVSLQKTYGLYVTNADTHVKHAGKNILWPSMEQDTKVFAPGTFKQEMSRRVAVWDPKKKVVVPVSMMTWKFGNDVFVRKAEITLASKALESNSVQQVGMGSLGHGLVMVPFNSYAMEAPIKQSIDEMVGLDGVAQEVFDKGIEIPPNALWYDHHAPSITSENLDQNEPPTTVKVFNYDMGTKTGSFVELHAMASMDPADHHLYVKAKDLSGKVYFFPNIVAGVPGSQAGQTLAQKADVKAGVPTEGKITYHMIADGAIVGTYADFMKAVESATDYGKMVDPQADIVIREDIFLDGKWQYIRMYDKFGNHSDTNDDVMNVVKAKTGTPPTKTVDEPKVTVDPETAPVFFKVLVNHPTKGWVAAFENNLTHWGQVQQALDMVTTSEGAKYVDGAPYKTDNVEIKKYARPSAWNILEKLDNVLVEKFDYKGNATFTHKEWHADQSKGPVNALGAFPHSREQAADFVKAFAKQKEGDFSPAVKKAPSPDTPLNKWSVLQVLTNLPVSSAAYKELQDLPGSKLMMLGKPTEFSLWNELSDDAKEDVQNSLAIWYEKQGVELPQLPEDMAGFKMKDVAKQIADNQLDDGTIAYEVAGHPGTKQLVLVWDKLSINAVNAILAAYGVDPQTMKGEPKKKDEPKPDAPVNYQAFIKAVPTEPGTNWWVSDTDDKWWGTIGGHSTPQEAIDAAKGIVEPENIVLNKMAEPWLIQALDPEHPASGGGGMVVLSIGPKGDIVNKWSKWNSDKAEAAAKEYINKKHPGPKTPSASMPSHWTYDPPEDTVRYAVMLEQLFDGGGTTTTVIAVDNNYDYILEFATKVGKELLEKGQLTSEQGAITKIDPGVEAALSIDVDVLPEAWPEELKAKYGALEVSYTPVETLGVNGKNILWLNDDWRAIQTGKGPAAKKPTAAAKGPTTKPADMPPYDPPIDAQQIYTPFFDTHWPTVYGKPRDHAYGLKTWVPKYKGYYTPSKYNTLFLNWKRATEAVNDLKVEEHHTGPFIITRFKLTGDPKASGQQVMAVMDSAYEAFSGDIVWNSTKSQMKQAVQAKKIDIPNSHVPWNAWTVLNATKLPGLSPDAYTALEAEASNSVLGEITGDVSHEVMNEIRKLIHEYQKEALDKTATSSELDEMPANLAKTTVGEVIEYADIDGVTKDILGQWELTDPMGSIWGDLNDSAKMDIDLAWTDLWVNILSKVPEKPGDHQLEFVGDITASQAYHHLNLSDSTKAELSAIWQNQGLEPIETTSISDLQNDLGDASQEEISDAFERYKLKHGPSDEPTGSAEEKYPVPDDIKDDLVGDVMGAFSQKISTQAYNDLSWRDGSSMMSAAWDSLMKTTQESLLKALGKMKYTLDDFTVESLFDKIVLEVTSSTAADFKSLDQDMSMAEAWKTFSNHTRKDVLKAAKANDIDLDVGDSGAAVEPEKPKPTLPPGPAAWPTPPKAKAPKKGKKGKDPDEAAAMKALQSWKVADALKYLGLEGYVRTELQAAAMNSKVQTVMNVWSLLGSETQTAIVNAWIAHKKSKQAKPKKKKSAKKQSISVHDAAAAVRKWKVVDVLKFLDIPAQTKENLEVNLDMAGADHMSEGWKLISAEDRENLIKAYIDFYAKKESIAREARQAAKYLFEAKSKKAYPRIVRVVPGGADGDRDLYFVKFRAGDRQYCYALGKSLHDMIFKIKKHSEAKAASVVKARSQGEYDCDTGELIKPQNDPRPAKPPKREPSEKQMTLFDESIEASMYVMNEPIVTETAYRSELPVILEDAGAGALAYVDQNEYQQGLSDEDQKVRDELGGREYPATAEDGKAFLFHWADGRGTCAFKHKKDAIAWIEDDVNHGGGGPDIVGFWYDEPLWPRTKRKGKKQRRMRVSTKYKKKPRKSKKTESDEAPGFTKFWYNARTGDSIEFPYQVHHAKVVAEQPERFGLSPDDVAGHLRGELSPWDTELFAKVGADGWVRAIVTGGMIGTDLSMTGNDRADLLKALKYIMADNQVDRVHVEWPGGKAFGPPDLLLRTGMRRSESVNERMPSATERDVDRDAEANQMLGRYQEEPTNIWLYTDMPMKDRVAWAYLAADRFKGVDGEDLVARFMETLKQVVDDPDTFWQQIEEKDPARATYLRNLDWDLSTVSLTDVGVYPRFSGFSPEACHGNVIQTADYIQVHDELPNKVAKLEEMSEVWMTVMKFLPPILVPGAILRSERPGYEVLEWTCDDGNHRLVAAAMAGATEAVCFTGKSRKGQRPAAELTRVRVR